MWDFLIKFTANDLIFVLLALTLTGAFTHFHRHYGRFVMFLLQMGVAALFGLVIISILQVLFPTDRPFVALSTTPLFPHPMTPSFPSSHAVYSGILVGFLAQVNERWGWLGFILAVLIGVGRVLGLVHYPIDVLVGLAIGLLLSLAIPWIWNRKLVGKAVAGRA